MAIDPRISSARSHPTGQIILTTRCTRLLHPQPQHTTQLHFGALSSLPLGASVRRTHARTRAGQRTAKPYHSVSRAHAGSHSAQSLSQAKSERRCGVGTGGALSALADCDLMMRCIAVVSPSATLQSARTSARRIAV